MAVPLCYIIDNTNQNGSVTLTRRTAMRDYTITKIKPGTYLLDLYVNGSWVADRRGTKQAVEQYASSYINKRMPQRFIMT
jgi:outer membrane usher protein FimD/PapC